MQGNRPGGAGINRGPGATNQDMGRGPGGQQAGQGDSPDDPTKLKYEQLYAPEHLASSGPNLRAPNLRRGKSGMIVAEVQGPAAMSKSYAPIYEVLPTYEKQAEEAMETNRIPAQHRRRVREYFDGLNAATER